MDIKKGDKIRILKGCNASFLKGVDMTGKLFTVEATFNDYVGIILPYNLKGEGHSLLGKLKGTEHVQDGWWIKEDNVELVTNEFWYKLGDKVVLKDNKLSPIYTIVYVDGEGNCALSIEKEGKLGLTATSASFMELLYKLYEPDSEVVITITACPKKRTTVAMMKKGDKEIGVAVAKCNPIDEWDAMYGAQLAMRRLVDKVGATPMLNIHDVKMFLQDRLNLDKLMEVK